MRRKLVVPFHLSGVGVQRNNGAGIKIVSRTRIAIPVRAGVTGSPIHEIEFGIVAAGRPDGATAVLPRFPAPCFMTWFARFGDHVEPPFLVACFRVEGSDVTADAVF